MKSRTDNQSRCSLPLPLPLLLLFGVCVATALPACGPDGDVSGLSATEQSAESAKAPQPTGVNDLGLKPGDRRIEVEDSDFVGLTFAVSFDGKIIGYSPEENFSDWVLPMSPGPHRISIEVIKHGISTQGHVKVSVYSGVDRSISLPEPQALSSTCSFQYASNGLDFLTAFGKQLAECPIEVGQTLELRVMVGEAS